MSRGLAYRRAQREKHLERRRSYLVNSLGYLTGAWMGFTLEDREYTDEYIYKESRRRLTTRTGCSCSMCSQSRESYGDTRQERISEAEEQQYLADIDYDYAYELDMRYSPDEHFEE